MAFAAVRPGDKEALVYAGGAGLDAQLAALDAFAGAADFVLGHNIIKHDLPHLAMHRPSIKLLKQPAIDTLWLNPLAFPRNPYHRLVKHYQDGRLQAGHVNDPKMDAALAMEALTNQIEALAKMDGENAAMARVCHYLATRGSGSEGVDAVFTVARNAPCPESVEAKASVRELLAGAACVHQAEQVFATVEEDGWPLAYALSWIAVAGGNSVMPPWVRYQFSAASEFVRLLRDTPCKDADCAWCREQNDPRRLLKRWFGFDGFRPKPAGRDGVPLQEAIAAAALSKTSVLGVLPTGTGKSICYQLPALAQFEKTGALTVVISPLVALMADQVASMERQNITAATTINGALSLPERQEALDKVRLGDAAILLISPEQLRSRSVRSVLQQREVGYWVLDEAHCVSKWGHDFRPDYRYIARYISERHGGTGMPERAQAPDRKPAARQGPAPLICLTATAKPEVIRDISTHFKERLGTQLELLDGGSKRDNLSFQVIPTDQGRKFGDLVGVLEDTLSASGASGIIVYCSTRKATERLAESLVQQGVSASHYHAGLPPERKKEVQQEFQKGELHVIVATNAFGMGIDKPDIRLVIHADIPASLENYLQEAGRAGRDQEAARCVLLFNHEDIERQFGLAARSRLEEREIVALLKALRQMERKTRQEDEVIATSGEIVKEESDWTFVRDSATDDTRVKTAVSWLEEAALLRREENRVSVYPSSLKVRTSAEAEALLDKAKGITEAYRQKLLALVRSLINAPADEGVSTDQLGAEAGLSSSGVRKALYDLESLGIASNDTAITVFVHIGVQDSSQARLQEASSLEASLIAWLREQAPDLVKGEKSQLNIRLASQQLRDGGEPQALPHVIERLLRGIARDGRDEEESVGSLQVHKRGREHLLLRLGRDWAPLDETAQRRRTAASLLLRALVAAAPSQARGKDVQVETTLGKLTGVLAEDMHLQSRSPSKLLDRALLWLHEQGVVTLGKGLTVFRPAMTIHLEKTSKRFTHADYQPLRLHYDEQVMQIHIMAAYAERGMASMKEALQLAEDYFTMEKSKFIAKWLPNKAAELVQQTTPESWQRIVGSLGSPQQQRIVADDRENTNVLALAGPGSGKTRALVHRIAYLVRAKRQNPAGILALVYNRHAAVDIKRRLFDLIGEDARGVTVSTCHRFAMRMLGASFAGQAATADDRTFAGLLKQAVALITGEGLPEDEAEAQRELLMEGYRWILVDEYQDIGGDEYALIAAIAGRSVEDPGSRLCIFAVGDDDQNIYTFKGASVEFIRRFEQDYNAKPVYLTENYRSTAHIIAAANQAIAPARERMKAGRDIAIDRRRKGEPAGGQLDHLDPVGRGRVQVIKCADSDLAQAVIAMQELERLAALVPNWDWTRAAVIAREWRYLQPVRSYCEAKGIPVQSAEDEQPKLWWLSETRSLVAWLEAGKGLLHVAEVQAWLDAQPEGPWWSLLREGAQELAAELGESPASREDLVDWLAEWCRDARRCQTGLLLLSAHRAKGLEFDHLAVLDGGWLRSSHKEDQDAPRRLYYVAMTRARQSLALVSMKASHPFLPASALGAPAFLERQGEMQPDTSACERIYQTLTLRDVYLDYGGRLPAHSPALAALSKLKPGDSLSLKQTADGWTLIDGQGVSVCRLAKGYAPPAGTDFTGFSAGSVYAMMRRRRSDYHAVQAPVRTGIAEPPARQYAPVKRDEWPLVLPQLVFTRR